MEEEGRDSLYCLSGFIKAAAQLRLSGWDLGAQSSESTSAVHTSLWQSGQEEMTQLPLAPAAFSQVHL